jgi:hypothetical protein
MAQFLEKFASMIWAGPKVPAAAPAIPFPEVRNSHERG